MKHFAAFLLLLMSLSNLSAQTTLFSENFNSGTAGGFTLNTSDVSSTTAPGSYNYWLVNNVYTGGSGTLVCFAPLPFSVATTASQPGGITGAPNSHYLHTISDAATSSGILASSYAASDGFCFFDENIFAKMSTDISTVGFTGTTLTFWWACGGGPSIYGELYYSTNSGSSWTLVTTPLSQYKSQTTWTQATVSLPAFDGKATLRFGFRFFNAISASAADPGMSIDDFVISATPAVTNTITTGSLSPLEYCSGTTITVDYTATGTFTGGNVFSCELSDASGSFAAPTIMGGIASTALLGSFGATFPVGTPNGTGYRIRVTSNSPAVVGTDNGSDITLWQKPVITGPPAITDSICEFTSVSLPASSTVGTLQWQQSSDGINWVGTGFSGSPYNSPPLTDNTWFRAYVVNGICDTVFSDTVVAGIAAPPTAFFTWSSSGLDGTFTDGSTGAVAWNWSFGDGGTSTLASPTHTYTSVGNYTVTLIVVNAYGCTDTFVDSVDILLGRMDPFGEEPVAFHPNPFDESVMMEVQLPPHAVCEIEIMSPDGRRVLNERLTADGSGVLRHIWKAGAQVPAGIYLVRIASEGGEKFARVVKL